MPQTGAQVAADLADTSLNPPRVIAQPQTGKGAHGNRVQLNLVFDGVNVDMTALFGAFQTLYGAGKVTSDRDRQMFGVYDWRIVP